MPGEYRGKGQDRDTRDGVPSNKKGPKKGGPKKKSAKSSPPRTNYTGPPAPAPAPMPMGGGLGVPAAPIFPGMA